MQLDRKETLTMAASKKSLNFERNLEQLETLVTEMESGELSLEDSLSAFEKGIKLTRECQSALQTAEQKVQKLIEENGQLIAADFEEADDINLDD